MEKEITKENCVACKGEYFIGEVGEVQEHLCPKHLKEHLDESVKMVKDYLNNCPN